MKRIFYFLTIICFTPYSTAAEIDQAYQKYLQRCHEAEERSRIVQEQLIAYMPRDLANIIKGYLEPRPCISYDQWQKNNYDLITAAFLNDIEKVKKLLNLGEIYINAEDDHGFTALMWSSKNNHKEIVKLLIDANADVNINDYGSSALTYAKNEGHQDIVELLKKAGATF